MFKNRFFGMLSKQDKKRYDKYELIKKQEGIGSLGSVDSNKAFIHKY